MDATSCDRWLSEVPDHDHWDLKDNEADLLKWPKLRGILLILRETLTPIHLDADRDAQRQQKMHSFVIAIVAIFGTLAVICAIFELSDLFSSYRYFLSRLEVLSAVIALIGVGVGIYMALHPHWLLNRFLSEQCRFVKFQYILNPAAWYNRPDHEVRSELQEILQNLRSKDRRLIRQWVTWQLSIAKRFQAAPAGIPEDVMREIRQYYMAKRLTYQFAYFHTQAKKRMRWETWTRFFSPVCFFLSILAAFAHFIFELLSHEDHDSSLHTLAAICVLLAASLPVLAMGVRTVRTAHEFGRNHLRFEGMAHFLCDTLTQVEGEQSPAAVFAHFKDAESALESEHRAWLRLMLEAEWFG